MPKVPKKSIVLFYLQAKEWKYVEILNLMSKNLRTQELFPTKLVIFSGCLM